MQTKITMRYHYTRLSKILNFHNIKCWHVCEATRTFIHCSTEYKPRTRFLWKIKIDGCFQITRIEWPF